MQTRVAKQMWVKSRERNDLFARRANDGCQVFQPLVSDHEKKMLGPLSPGQDSGDGWSNFGGEGWGEGFRVFSLWNFCFSHYNFEMVNQCFHVIIYFFFRRKKKIRNVCVENTFRFFFYFFYCLFDDLHTFPHLLLTHHEAIIGVTIGTNRYNEIKIFIS